MCGGGERGRSLDHGFVILESPSKFVGPSVLGSSSLGWSSRTPRSRVLPGFGTGGNSGSGIPDWGTQLRSRYRTRVRRSWVKFLVFELDQEMSL